MFTGLLVASFTVIWSDEVAVPLAVTAEGVAVRKLAVVLGEPVTNVTEACNVIPANFAETVSVPAPVLFNVTEHVPPAAVVQLVELKLVPEPVELKVTAWPVIALAVESLTVTWSDVVLVPSSGSDVGDAENALSVLLGEPSTNVTAAVLLMLANAAVTVTVCAKVLLRVTVHWPAAVVHVVELKA